MKSWKNRWMDELDTAVPALREDVLLAEIPQRERIEAVETQSAVSPKPWYKETYELLYKQLFSTPKRLATSLAACAASLAIVGTSIYFVITSERLENTGVVTATADVISVEINPQAAFSVNQKGIVTAVVALNHDADVILAEERYIEMEGRAIGEAVQIFADYSARLGYVDLDAEGAVRVTSCAENGYIDDAIEGLETYFQKMGAYIAVAEETLELKEFCTRVKMDIVESVETLKKSVERIPTLLLDRESEGKTEEELAILYRENIPMEEVKNLFIQGVQKGMDKKDAIDEIAILADKIFWESSSPMDAILGTGYKHYWDLLQESVTNPTLLKLMQEMKGKLLAYELNYGVRLENGAQLQKELEVCQVAYIEYLAEILLNDTLEIFAERFEQTIEILQLIGIDTSFIQEFYTPPHTAQEYHQELLDYTHEQYMARKAWGQEIYEHARAEITKDSYRKFLDELQNAYGSLNAYFESLREGRFLL
ncbi:MAG: hypothetical protein IJW96_01830 [Clostridia bacterium]|nr:hypothetical protein [Clostridia bacterium]